MYANLGVCWENVVTFAGMIEVNAAFICSPFHSAESGASLASYIFVFVFFTAWGQTFALASMMGVTKLGLTTN